jgi:hypothetical protein
MHIAMDNFVSGDKVFHYLGEEGWKGTMTCRCNCLPKSAPRKYFNLIKAAPVNARSKVARFEQQIIAVKHIKHQDSDTSQRRGITFFAMYNSNKQEEPTYPQ